MAEWRERGSIITRVKGLLAIVCMIRGTSSSERGEYEETSGGCQLLLIRIVEYILTKIPSALPRAFRSSKVPDCRPSSKKDVKYLTPKLPMGAGPVPNIASLSTLPVPTSKSLTLRELPAFISFHPFGRTASKIYSPAQVGGSGSKRVALKPSLGLCPCLAS